MSRNRSSQERRVRREDQNRGQNCPVLLSESSLIIIVSFGLHLQGYFQKVLRWNQLGLAALEVREPQLELVVAR